MKIAIAHDFLNSIGGAERVTLALSRIFPDAPIYTLFINRRIVGDFFTPLEIIPNKRFSYFTKNRFLTGFKNKKIITSSLQKKAQFLRFRHKYLLPLMPQAVEELNFTGFDVVISSESAWMKGILTKPETLHISYCHTPTRFLWVDREKYLAQQGLGFLQSFLARRMLSKIMIWDRLAADRVDYWLANSFLTKERIRKFYKKEAEVIYPPVDTSRFNLRKTKKDYFLVISRLSPYKMVDLAVLAFNKLGLNLIIIGEGSQKKELERKAKKNIKFLGFQDDEQILRYYKECRAFVFPTFYEDFGLTPVEAMACGKPVIASGVGGSRESLEEGETGEFFFKPSGDSLAEAVERFLKKEESFNPQKIREHALKFDRKVFESKIKNFVEEKYNEVKGN